MKIAIVGASPMTYMDAPWDDKSWKICPMNDMYLYHMPRWDEWYQIHPLDDLDFSDADDRSTPEEFFKFAGTASGPIWVMPGDEDKIPTGVALPRQEILDEFGPEFLSSCVAWMMAHAILQEPEEIGLWGCCMADETEYATQRPGLWHFEKEAARRGIPVFISPESELATRPLPYPEEHELRPKYQRRLDIHEATRDKVKRLADECQQQLIFMNGQINVLSEYRDVLPDFADRFTRLEKERDAAGNKWVELMKEYAQLGVTVEEIKFNLNNLP